MTASSAVEHASTAFAGASGVRLDAARRAAARAARVVVIFRNDDPSAVSDVAHERRIADIFERFNAPQVIGVIPNCAAEGFRDPRGVQNVPLADNSAMIDFLRSYAERSGSEIALHGFTHRTNRLSNPARREYFEFRAVGRATQAEWLARGVEMIDRALGVRPRTFIPPWNRLDDDTLWACAENGLNIVSAGDYTPAIPGLNALGTNASLADVPRMLAAATDSSRRTLLRVLYHSRTTRTDAEIAELETAVRTAATTPGVFVATLREVIELFPDEAARANDAARNTVDPTELWGTPRAGAALYGRAAAKLGAPPIAAQMRSQARQACERGDYAAACMLTPTLDSAALRTVALGRFSALFIGVIAGGVAIAAARLSGINGAYWFAAAVAAACATSGEWLARRATAPDTRRELRVAALLATAGAAAAAALAFFFSGKHAA